MTKQISLKDLNQIDIAFMVNRIKECNDELRYLEMTLRNLEDKEHRAIQRHEELLTKIASLKDDINNKINTLKQCLKTEKQDIQTITHNVNTMVNGLNLSDSAHDQISDSKQPSNLSSHEEVEIATDHADNKESSSSHKSEYGLIGTDNKNESESNDADAEINDNGGLTNVQDINFPLTPPKDISEKQKSQVSEDDVDSQSDENQTKNQTGGKHPETIINMNSDVSETVELPKQTQVKKKPNKWLDFVTDYKKQHPGYSHSQALKEAAKVWKSSKTN